MSESQIWIVAGIILFILEIITPGYVLANFGVAAIASGVAAWLGADMTIQIIVFVAVSLISFVVVRPILSKTMLNKGEPTPTGASALIGRTAHVVERIPPAPDAGRVKIDGDNWQALSVDGKEIAEGAIVKVVRTESIRLFVEPATSN